MRTSPFSEEHDQLRAMVRRFAEQELSPHARQWEQDGWFADWVFPRLGELGLLGLTVPEEYGGAGSDYWSTVVLAEELPRAGSGSVTMAVSVQTDMATPPILKFGTEEQKQAYLAPAVRGEKIGAIGISEPDAGSDVRAVRTRARSDGSDWVINGAKTYITNGLRADFVTMVVRTADPDPNDPWGGISLFLVDTDLPGFEATKLDKVGMRASDTGMIHLTDVRVPGDALLGTLHEGFKQIMWELQGERLVVSISAVAGAQLLLDRTMAYTQEREAFGRSLSRFQVTRHKLVELATRIEAVRSLVYECADAWNRGIYATTEIAMCKLAAAQLSFDVADACLQLHGGYGYSREFDIERAWRDSRLGRIGGGADEVQREIIGRLVLAQPTRRSGERASVDLSPTTTAATSALPLFAPEHDQLRDSARTFIEREIAPHVEEWEHAEDFPKELFKAAGGAGFLGLKFDPELGGSGPDLVAAAVWIEELARCGSGGIAADLGATTDLAALYVANAGTTGQQQRFLPPLLAGERVGALAITEPDAGSDVAGITTKAVRDGDDWIIDGSKVFITNGVWCDDVVVAAKVSPGDGAPSEDPHGQITLFLVSADAEGFTRRRMPMLGWRTSHTGELTFDGVRISDDRRLGEVGSGFAHIMSAFAWERVTMALGAVAGAEGTLEVAIAYAQQREAFGRPIASFQVWRHRFADLATRIASGRALTYRALRLVVAHAEGSTPLDPTEVLRTVAMAKLVTQRLAFDVADEGVQVHGGAGYMMEYPIQRAWRDARLGPIGGGTDEIMKEIIAKTYRL